MILVRDNFSIAAIDDYFGHGKNVDAVVNQARIKGVLDNPLPDESKAGTIVIDVMDTRTNKLIYRNLPSRDTSDGISNSARAERINQAVTEALAGFYR